MNISRPSVYIFFYFKELNNFFNTEKRCNFSESFLNEPTYSFGRLWFETQTFLKKLFGGADTPFMIWPFLVGFVAVETHAKL